MRALALAIILYILGQGLCYIYFLDKIGNIGLGELDEDTEEIIESLIKDEEKSK